MIKGGNMEIFEEEKYWDLGGIIFELRPCNRSLKENEFEIKRRQRKKMCSSRYHNHLLLKENEFEIRRRQRKKIRPCCSCLFAKGFSSFSMQDISFEHQNPLQVQVVSCGL